MNSSTLLDWLLRSSLEASVLIAGVLLLRNALGPRLSPGWRIALWIVVGAKLMLPVSLPALPGLGSLWPQETSAIAAASTTPSSIIQTAAVTQIVTSERVEKAAQVVTAGSSWSPSVGEATLAVWLAGVVSLLGIALVREMRFRRSLARMEPCRDEELNQIVQGLARELGLRQNLRVLLCSQRIVPAVAGLHHPVLLMPSDWREMLDQDALAQVLRHELGHVKHHDLWWNWAALAVNAVHWFNPLVWHAVAVFNEERELRCDAGALAASSPRERIAYGRVLLQFQEAFTAPAATAGVAPFVRNHPPLRQRILMITQPATHRPWLHAVAALSLGLFVCAAFGADRTEEDKSATRTREGERSGGTREEVSKPSTGKAMEGEREGAAREGSGDRGREKAGARDGEKGREGEAGKSAERGREGAAKEGEGGAKRGARDGEGAKAGPRDGEGSKSGARDGEGGSKRGMRDGEGSRSGARDGEGGKTGKREDGRASATSETGGSLVLRVIDGGESVMVGKEKVALNQLRRHLSEVMPEHAGAKVSIEADDDVPFKTVGQVLDAARDNGAKGAQIQSATASNSER